MTPLVKVGGLGDAVLALTKALAKLGLNISVILPRYEFIDKKELQLVAEGILVTIGNKKEKVSLYKKFLPDSGIEVFFVENNDYLSRGPAPYFEQTAFVGAKREIQRFVFFSKAVFELLKTGALRAPDIIHCNDWHTGALAALLARKNAEFHAEQRRKIPRQSASSLRNSAIRPKVVFTIHNLSNQGKWNSAEINNWFLAKGKKSPFRKFGTNYNFIAEGILNADWLTTVSPTYAKEILTKKYGAGLEKILKTRAKNLTGILNGIDYEFYNPADDKRIFQNYSAKTIDLKTANKIALQNLFDLRQSKTIPLFGLVARLTDQKGIDFIIKTLPEFLKENKTQFVFLGRGLKKYEDALVKFAKKWPERIYTKIGFDEKLAHRIYAASDFFLMPSRFEPSGLGQMISMRYGTIPIVRNTGGLHDTVKHLKTGFVFKNETVKDFQRILELAINYFTRQPEKIKAIQKNCLRENFDFSRSAKEYADFYKKLLRE